MKKTVTIQDIAEALNLSRNTVSKALNNRTLPEKTKQLVLEKAFELGYKGFNQPNSYIPNVHDLKIMLTTSKPITSMNFFLELIKGIEDLTSSQKIELIQYNPLIFNDIVDNVKQAVDQYNISGILCIETFDSEIIEALLALDIPIVFIDFPIDKNYDSQHFDIISIESISTVSTLCSRFIQDNHIKTIGYIGDYLHCQTFYDRYLGMIDAIIKNNLIFDPEYSFTKKDTFSYGDIESFSNELATNKIPELYICANDFLAISLIQSLKKLGYNVPDDVMVVGFDNILEADVFTPSLTTINVDKRELGRQAVHTLLDRIRFPKNVRRVIQLPTAPIYRNSTSTL